MELQLKDNLVSIRVLGLEYIRLKAKLAPILGEKLVTRRLEILFPKSSLPLVEGLLELNQASSEIVSALSKYKHHEVARQKVINILEEGVLNNLPERWADVLELAQAVAVSCMIQEELLGLCLFDEQGSGKTVMTIAAFDLLREAKLLDSMIVVCPKSMVSEWPKDLRKFLGQELKVATGVGSRSDKFNSATSEFDVLITNYEGVESMLTPLTSISNSKKFLLVIDESYYAKNENSHRADDLGRLREICTKCFVLCGTPAPNSAHDLVNQFNLADQGYTFGGFKKSRDPSADWGKISSLIDSRGTYIRRLKPEVLDFVPEKNFHVLKVPLVGKQRLMYETARDKLELELRSFDDEIFKKRVATYLQKRAALLRICCCPSSVDPTATELPAKFAVLDPLLESLVKQGRKVIVWSYFRKSIDEVLDRYRKYKPVRVDGSVSGEERTRAVSSFQTDPDVLLFVGNPAAAGAGITLHSSHDAIYISYSNQAAHYLQSLDRIHRRGQVSAAVNYYLLVCEGTIEETEVVRLRRKEIRQHALLGDVIAWPTSLDEALGELNTGNV